MKFTEKEFDQFRNFQRRMEREFGENSWVGTDNVSVLVEYSPELKAQIRPLPETVHFEFELKHLHCKCGKGRVFLCLPNQMYFTCDECLTKQKNMKAAAS